MSSIWSKCQDYLPFETNIQEWCLLRAEDKVMRGVADSADDGDFKF